MRILLIKPYPDLLVARRLQEGFLHLEPLELEIVAGGIPEENDVKIFDLSLEKDPIKAFRIILEQMSPDMVGFTSYSSNSYQVKKLAGIVKKQNSSIITVVGGLHATIVPHDFAVDDIDIIVRGEGGTAMGEIVNRFKQNRPLFFDNRSLSPKDPEFNLKVILPAPDYPKVEEIPAPRRDLVKRSHYYCVWTSSPGKKLDSIFPRVASLRTSLGCAFSCSFCVVPKVMNGKYLQRKPEDVVDEIESLSEKYIYFVDDEMFLNAARARQVAELLLKRKIKKHYISWARSDTIIEHPDLFRLWKKAGLSTVYVGLESMDKASLDYFNKKTGVETNRKAVVILRDIGITLHASFIVKQNFTKKDFKQLEQDVKDICPAELTFTVLSPSPGTPFWYEQKDRFICDSFKYYDCMHTILPTRLPLRQFYQHFSDLYSSALRYNPLRVNKVRYPLRELIKVVFLGIKFVVATRTIYKDYLSEQKK